MRSHCAREGRVFRRDSSRLPRRQAMGLWRGCVSPELKRLSPTNSPYLERDSKLRCWKSRTFHAKHPDHPGPTKLRSRNWVSPLRYVAKIGGYILKQHLTGRKRYPLVMMMSPCSAQISPARACGKIDYPEEILNKRLPVDEALESVREWRRTRGGDRRRRAASPQGSSADRGRHHRAEEVRHRLHERAPP